MNDRCTPATARRLKDQGFAQPDPRPGHVFYDEYDGAIVIVRGSILGYYGIYAGTDRTVEISGDMKSMAYAPTAPDILRELGQDYALVYAGGEPTLISTVEKRLPFLYKHPNPAECCAMQWQIKQEQL